ncbi:acyl-CoA N-acyltransferase [Fusarium tricinctum]|jgi:GNAT superfamily N-acetyltransferase|uniref:Acyl-CoA N-acyltransferase n=1 Tax=Fusarium tricinctum TaxID=61284 RepID=A0A8K0RLV3_9HYPO|nr:acyl-CoA N-acyltransferase [Fusarium tricinctum]
MEGVMIQLATSDQIPAIVDFIITAREDMFPFLDKSSNDQLAKTELANFHKTYLDNPQGAFITAQANGRLIGSIGYRAYDGRFSHFCLEPDLDQVVEVVRLYVHPEFRRAGLASNLFATLLESARHRGLKQLYLHTHPFLPNASGFWKRQGFSVITVDDDPIWQTIHMSRQSRTGEDALVTAS